jgi:3'(2'), 5'-bisphosphate nucleotidase
MTHVFTSDQLDKLIELVRLAGEDILTVYRQPELTNQVSKQDKSPVTAADLAAHRRLAEGLHQILDIPLLSEESATQDYAQRHQWKAYWLVDPLDGTRDFLAHNDQFTVNVALIYQGLPLLGVVYQPVTELIYWGVNAHADWHFPVTGAWRQLGTDAAVPIQTTSLLERQAARQSLRCLISQHHHSPKTDEYLRQLSNFWPASVDIHALGSSLKICALAEGSADLYLRLGPTSEWDTAAGQAVLEAAGGQLVRFNMGGKSFLYNQRNTLLNKDFCACTNPDLIIKWLAPA